MATLAENDLCLCSQTETVNHYLLKCFLYQNERSILFEKLDKILPKFSKLPDKRKMDIILNGIHWLSKHLYYKQEVSKKFTLHPMYFYFCFFTTEVFLP